MKRGFVGSAFGLALFIVSYLVISVIMAHYFGEVSFAASILSRALPLYFGILIFALTGVLFLVSFIKQPSPALFRMLLIFSFGIQAIFILISFFLPEFVVRIFGAGPAIFGSSISTLRTMAIVMAVFTLFAFALVRFTKMSLVAVLLVEFLAAVAAIFAAYFSGIFLKNDVFINACFGIAQPMTILMPVFYYSTDNIS